MEKNIFLIREAPNKRISVNDALTNDIFSLTDEDFQKTIGDGEARQFLEGRTSKHGRIQSSYWLSVLDEGNVNISRPLDEFDRDILDACLSAQSSGNEVITERGIWKFITGNRDAEPTSALRKEILERIDKLASIRLTVDISHAVKAGFYPSGTTCRIRSTVLPCDVIEATVNGQIISSVIKFRGESPLLSIARSRGGKRKQAAQILTYDNRLLKVSNQRWTATTIGISNYIVRRVVTAKNHKNTAKTILFSTLLKHCGLSDAGKWQRQDVRKATKNVMQHLVNVGEIQRFEFVKDGGEFTKITFSFNAENVAQATK